MISASFAVAIAIVACTDGVGMSKNTCALADDCPITVPASSVLRFINKFEPAARNFFTMIAASLRASARYFSSAEN